MTSTHEFALFFPQLSQINANNNQSPLPCSIDDPDLVHRIQHVLRLAPDEQCVLFDRLRHGTFTIQTVSKKRILGSITAITENRVLTPIITYCVPLLKRDALDQALYALTEMGITTIQLVSTHKSGRMWTDKEFERAQRVIIAAAEQSKHFAYPKLLPPIPFKHMLSTYMNTVAYKLYCDPAGETLWECIQQVYVQNPAHIILMAGPEADLTNEEKEQLRVHQVRFCALTPTVLRAYQAIALSAGVFRALSCR